MQNGLYKVNDPNIVGIDLGTTNSVVAIMKNNKPMVIMNELGFATTPSIVRVGEKETVGEEAKAYLVSDAANTIFASKRLIGRKFKDPEIQEYLKGLPYKTIQSCNGDVWIKTSVGKFSPTQIGAKILSKMRQIAERALGVEVKRAVVTVPAYFNDAQRQATKDAGKIAGLDVIRVINEPTAAALAYGLGTKNPEKIVVYDLGGGTFDVSVLEVEDGIFHVRATNGNTFLGGEDFDSEIARFILNLFEQQEGVKLDRTVLASEKLREAAVKAKIELSTKLSTDVFVENIVDGQDLDVKITRDQMESVVKKVAQRTVEPCEKALRDAGMRKKDISKIIMVGGMTKMPYIRQLVQEIFGKEPKTDVDPDEAVAQGAAIQAGVLGGSVEDVVLLDVIPLSLGIETLGGVFSKIISRNTTIPFKHTETFSTSEDNQSEVDIRVYQGERGLVTDNMPLGSIKLVNLPKAPRGKPRIEVTFEADTNGIIKVSATDAATRKRQEIEITPSSGLTIEEVERMVKEAENQRENDLLAAKRIEFRNEKRKQLERLLIGGVKLPAEIIKAIHDLQAKIEMTEFDLETAKREIKKIEKRVSLK